MTLRPAQGGQRFAPGRATTPGGDSKKGKAFCFLICPALTSRVFSAAIRFNSSDAGSSLGRTIRAGGKRIAWRDRVKWSYLQLFESLPLET